MVKVRVPATIANCGPGFDCIGFAVTLYSYVEMDFSDSPKIEVEGEENADISKQEDNLVYKAAQLVLRKCGCAKKLHIRIKNEIPLARGLGSSAAAIVSGVLAANLLLGEPLDEEKMINLAAEIEGHPDNVTPAFLGGFVVTSMEQGKVIYKKLTPPVTPKVVVAVPEYKLSTKVAREVLPKRVDLSDALFNISRSTLLVASLCSGDLSTLRLATQDALHQPYRRTLVPGMDEIIEKSLLIGALGCFLSGAGPSIAAFAESEQKARELGLFMVKVFEKNRIKAHYKILDICDDGAVEL